MIPFLPRKADEARAVRGLLAVEDTLAAEAVKDEPKDDAAAAKLEQRNHKLTQICDQIIADADAGAVRAADAGTRKGNDETAKVVALVGKAKSESDHITIGDQFEMQLLMNHLADLGTMATSVVSASDSAIKVMASTSR